MSRREVVRLQLADTHGGQELDIHEVALIRELVQDDRYGPDTLVSLDGSWVRLDAHPTAPWLGPMARAAIAAARRGDPTGLAHHAGQVIRYAAGHPDADRREEVRIAQLLIGHLRLTAGRAREAVGPLETAAGVASRFSPTALNNLGVAWALLREPENALRALESALTEDPTFLVARLSLRNLAATLAAETAPALPGRPTWAELARREDDALSEAPTARVHDLLDRHRPFPDASVWKVFERAVYYPSIGSNLRPSPTGRLAAGAVLREAGVALHDARYDHAQLLALVAPKYDPATGPTATILAAEATARREELRQLAEARRFVIWLSAFLSALDGLTLENLDAAREAMSFLAPYLDEAALNRLYEERVEDLLLASIGGRSPERSANHRERLLTIARQFATSPRADAYRRAAARCRSEAALARFWQAVTCGELDAAAAALLQASATLDLATDSLDHHGTILADLEVPDAGG